MAEICGEIPSHIPVHQPFPKRVLSLVDKLETPKLRTLVSGSQENQRNFVPITSKDRPALDSILRLLEDYQYVREFFDPYSKYSKEGRRLSRLYYLRERNPKVIEAAKYAYMAEHRGHLMCEICGFDFLSKYGERGYGFIEGHHRLPLSQLRRERRTRPQDIALLCSNCHRMIHNKRPWLTVERLKSFVQANRA